MGRWVGPAHPWLSQATELLWARIDTLADVGPYDMRALFWFLDHVPDRDRARAAMEKIGPMIFDAGMVALDPETPGEVHFPLDFAPLPGSLARGLFDQQVIDAGLDHLAAAQRPDGSWTFNWMAWSPAAEREWRGHMTVERAAPAARQRPLLTAQATGGSRGSLPGPTRSIMGAMPWQELADLPFAAALRAHRGTLRAAR